MDMLTRRRMVAIGLSLSGMIAGSRLGVAQTAAPPPKPALPFCPEGASGVIGDWSWAGSAYGPALTAKRVTILERGDFIGDEKSTILYLMKNWVLAVNLQKPPTSDIVTIIAKSSAGTATLQFSVAGIKPPNTKNGVWSASFNVDPLLIGKAGPAYANEFAIELLDGNRMICKLAFGAKGFAEALRKANEVGTPIKQMADAGQCEPEELDPCYLTTLCVEEIGLPDDCFELQSLRAYRDGPLIKLPEGRAAIAEYYRDAPRIVAEIKRRGEARRVLRFYLSHILPCVAFARLGLNRLALWRYRDMMRQLQQAYG